LNSSAALRPLLNRSGAPTELPGCAEAAAILRRDPSGDEEVPSTAPAPPDRNLPPDAFPKREVYQVPDCVGVKDFPTAAIFDYAEADVE